MKKIICFLFVCILMIACESTKTSSDSKELSVKVSVLNMLDNAQPVTLYMINNEETDYYFDANKKLVVKYDVSSSYMFVAVALFLAFVTFFIGLFFGLAITN